MAQDKGSIANNRMENLSILNILVICFEKLGFSAASGRQMLFLATRLNDDSAVAKQCAVAFEAVWEHAVPHHDYQLR